MKGDVRMEINMVKPVKVNAKTLGIYLKVRDEFACVIKDQDGETIREYEGYVPWFMPGEHYGDYLILEIDIETGNITNWRTPKQKDMD
jgi:hypothetical protein